ncbi:unnamed protein product [Pleuronectes platessa]|uniref:Uncharacterized protein n=1 Tax=Pleuronectes platessa TaxID=8262 RepID=A0A9N7YCB6_PLEPL|nr:unnamed protein product [Pleuronectes platessa]
MEAMGVMLLIKNTKKHQLCGLNLSVMTKRGLWDDGGLYQLYRLYMKVEEIEPQGSVMDRDGLLRAYLSPDSVSSLHCPRFLHHQGEDSHHQMGDFTDWWKGWPSL